MNINKAYSVLLNPELQYQIFIRILEESVLTFGHSSIGTISYK
jgi:hypothetical protein